MRARVYPFTPRAAAEEIRRDIAPAMRRRRVKAWARAHQVEIALVVWAVLVTIWTFHLIELVESWL